MNREKKTIFVFIYSSCLWKIISNIYKEFFLTTWAHFLLKIKLLLVSNFLFPRNVNDKMYYWCRWKPKWKYFSITTKEILFSFKLFRLVIFYWKLQVYASHWNRNCFDAIHYTALKTDTWKQNFFWRGYCY